VTILADYFLEISMKLSDIGEQNMGVDWTQICNLRHQAWGGGGGENVI
jgi:hypothetical protein